jgi:hypothetical protein
MVSIVGIRGSIKATSALEVGFKRHGDSYTLVDYPQDIKDADCFIQTNLLKPKFYKLQDRASAYQFILDSGKPFLVSESPVFRKYPEWTRLGWYSYKWTDGIFGNENSPPDRWNKFQQKTGITFKEWNSPGDHILIMGQKEGDSSLSELYKDFESFYDWVSWIVIQIRQYSDRPIIIRPHPRNLRHGIGMCEKLNRNKNLNIKISNNLTEGGTQGGDGLDRDLQNAHCIITYNSLSAIEAVCEGIPTFAFDNGSMIWPIAHKDISQIENLNYNIDITQWKYDVAYTQWDRMENKTGESWAHLKPLFFEE